MVVILCDLISHRSCDDLRAPYGPSFARLPFSVVVVATAAAA